MEPPEADHNKRAKIDLDDGWQQTVVPGETLDDDARTDGGEDRDNRDPYHSPRRLGDVREDWIEECSNPELRRIELEGWKDRYALAEKWDRETGLPIKEYTLWDGHKGDFYSLWHAVIRFAARNQPDLLEELPVGDELRRSSSRDFGHTREGYAVEFNLAGFACRSLTVENRGEAEVIKSSIEGVDGTSRVEVVIDG